MQILLKNVTKDGIDFSTQLNKINFKGYLEYHTNKLILLKAELTGSFATECSRCGKDFELVIDEEVEFFVSDGIFKDDGIDLDVVESLNGSIDINEILISEIELVKSDYHSCDKCN